MRVRPIFWCFLAVCCTGVLIFAATLREDSPAILHVYLEQRTPVASGFTTVELHLTDPQGLPIEQAQVLPSAKMTNMDMITNHIRVTSQGEGNYSVQLQLYMAGPWEIRIVANADGFDPQQRTLFVQVQ
ncbi:MAG TPA: FixH family protein [Ktedonobacteraceae bacterium]|jgi:nitrogen fixation protein FixH|nr:FixH family protein [Ktedonobacteraceae bacterium]